MEQRNWLMNQYGMPPFSATVFIPKRSGVTIIHGLVNDGWGYFMKVDDSIISIVLRSNSVDFVVPQHEWNVTPLHSEQTGAFIFAFEVIIGANSMLRFYTMDDIWVARHEFQIAHLLT